MVQKIYSKIMILLSLNRLIDFLKIIILRYQLPVANDADLTSISNKNVI